MLQRWVAELATAEPATFWFWAAACGLGAIAAGWMAFRRLHNARLVEDTPPSRIRSAAQGYVRLEGFARLLPGPPILSPLSGERCCWWSYRIERRETTVRNGRRSTEWVTLEAGTSDELFLVVDDTGECIVDPLGATVYPSLERRWYGHTLRPQRVESGKRWFGLGQYRYSERLIQVGDALCALGLFRSQIAHQEQDRAVEVRALLTEWKRDRQQLLGRFDADGNGDIDAQEWEAVRLAAMEAVRAEELARALDPDIHVLATEPQGRPFLLSTLPAARLLGRQRLAATLYFGTALLLVLGFTQLLRAGAVLP